MRAAQRRALGQNDGRSKEEGIIRMIKISKVVGRYFDAWITLDTWDSFHPLDMQRFYRFVKAVVRYSRNPPSPSDVRALITARWHDQRPVDALDQAADRYAAIYETLISYEKTGGFPDALTERTSIVKFHGQLSSQENSSAQHIETTMSHVWGKDWQKKLAAALFPGSREKS